MNFKKYHVSTNLFDKSSEPLHIGISNDNKIVVGTANWTAAVPCKPNTTYTVSKSRGLTFLIGYTTEAPDIGVDAYGVIGSLTDSFTNVLRITTGDNAAYLIIVYCNDNFTNPPPQDVINSLNVNEGNEVLPYEAYYTPYWSDAPCYIHKTATDTITNLPADLYADGNNATVGLVGNMSQSGTPTPQTQITPSECGERTGNLFDEEYPNISGTVQYKPIYVGNGSFTLSTTTPYDLSAANIFLLSGNVTSGASTSGNGVWLNHNVTTQSDNGYITIAYRHYSGTTSPVGCNTMLNEGSTALPYEPYGYKIPISSASTTTPVYLGEVQSTRKIKKYEITGLEGWILRSGTPENVFFCERQGVNSINNAAICSHYPNQDSGSFADLQDKHFLVRVASSNDKTYLAIRDSSYPSTSEGVEQLRNYLQQQYAAGTPVCVWYVLATETTSVVNEPLRKIGDYADTVSGITIPTITGKDTFDVLTTLKPSEVSLSYTGWHDATVKEWDGSQWV